MKDKFPETGLVLIVGFHGVGKSMLLQELCKDFPYAFCASASQLLSWESNLKLTDNINSNQEKLVERLKSIKSRYPLVILDGHMNLIKSNGDFEFVGCEILKRLSPSLIVLVESKADTVKNRLAERDGTVWSVDKVNNYIQKERYWAKKVAHKFNIPLIICKN